jgi:hypothetical protein
MVIKGVCYILRIGNSCVSFIISYLISVVLDFLLSTLLIVFHVSFGFLEVSLKDLK